MSIKAIHIFLISCAVILSVLFACWSIGYSRTSGELTYFNAGVLSIFVAVGFAVYGIYFFQKAKSIL